MDVLTEGYALPVNGGLYPPQPYLYRGATAIIASYEADPAAITGLLPPGVTPLEDPPVCLAWVVYYPFSTLGVYNEVINRPSRDRTGNAFLCEDVLAAEA